MGLFAADAVMAREQVARIVFAFDPQEPRIVFTQKASCQSGSNQSVSFGRSLRGE